MQYKSPLAVVVMFLLVLVVSACATTEKMEKMPETVEPIVVGPLEPMVEAEPEPAFSERDALLQIDTFYFDYDSADLAISSDDALDVHAEEIIAKLGSNSNAVVTVEGHADERGTIEYNNALGSRRAEAVSSYLQVKGVPAENIETISYGELRPVAEGSDDTSWALNRRVVIDY